jgi:hypothetical protein
MSELGARTIGMRGEVKLVSGESGSLLAFISSQQNNSRAWLASPPNQDPTLKRVVGIVTGARLRSALKQTAQHFETEFGCAVEYAQYDRFASRLLLSAPNALASNEWDNIVCELSHLVLGTQHPLNHFHVTLFFPVDLRDPDHDDTEALVLPRTSLQSHVEQFTHPTGPMGARTRVDDTRPFDSPDRERDQWVQAQHYFLPELTFLFDRHDYRDDSTNELKSAKPRRPISQRRLRVPGKRQLVLHLVGGKIDPKLPANAKPDTWLDEKININSVDLYSFDAGMHILAIRLQWPDFALPFSAVDANWWHSLFQSGDTAFPSPGTYKTRTLESALSITKHARLLYPSFLEQSKEEKISKAILTGWEPLACEENRVHLNEVPANIGNGVSEVVRALLATFFIEKLDCQSDVTTAIDLLGKKLRYVVDDRMYAVPAYGLVGPPPTLNCTRAEAKRLHMLALYVDKASDTDKLANDHAYDSDFINGLYESHRYSRWEQIGSYSGICSYAAAFMGYGWFPNNVTLPSHVRVVYQRFWLVGLFYQQTLRHFQRRITVATRLIADTTGAATEDAYKSFSKINNDFIRFTNDYWFLQLSGQVQGQELFTRVRQQLLLQEEFDLVQAELQRAHDALNAQSALHQTRNATKLNETIATYTPWSIGLSATAAIAALGAVNPENIVDVPKVNLQSWAIGIVLIAAVAGIVLFRWVKKELATR